MSRHPEYTFPDELKISPVGQKMRRWKLKTVFRMLKNDKEFITVPKGFVTDLASIPRLFWNILPPFGRYGKPSVIHDYLYFSCLFQRKKADKIFLYAMESTGVGIIRRKVMYYAVRIFAKKAWENHRKRDKTGGR